MTKRDPLVVILGISAFFFIIFLIVTMATIMHMVSGKSDKKFFAKANQIGLIEIKGVILDSKKVLDQIESFSDDNLVKGVLVRINSPGGAVAPSQEVYDALKKLAAKKPVFSSMSSLAASGGYYVACGTKKIFANPGTITGSIGVIMQFADLSKLYQWVKVNPYSIKTGKFKDIGSPNREMSADEKALLQEMIDNVLAQFRKAVASARNLPYDRVVELSDGRIFSGEQAKTAKLVDELGGINEAIDALAKEAGVAGKPTIVRAVKSHKPWDRFFADSDEDSESESELDQQFQGGILRSIAKSLGLNLGSTLSSQPSHPSMNGALFLWPGYSL